MECPDCGAELIYHDFYGYLGLHQTSEKLGDIYKCPNHEGFPSEEEAAFLDRFNDFFDFDKKIKKDGEEYDK